MNIIDRNNIVEIVEGNLFLDENMSKHTTFGIGGKVSCYIMPKTIKHLKEVLKYSSENKINISFIGSGSNLLVSDHGYDGIIISLKKTFKNLNILRNGTIIAESGVMLGKLVKESMKRNLTGLESLIGVPGTLGGALVMNAGAFGGEISNYLISVDIMTSKGELKTYDASDIDFSYRFSSFTTDEFISL